MTYRGNSFPLVEGQVNLTSGTYKGGVYLCAEDGSISITWASGGVDSITCTQGEAFNLVNGVDSVTITAGTFHRA